MKNLLTNREEENLHGFTGDMKEFLRMGDFESALILINDLKKYVKRLKGLKKFQKRGKNDTIRSSVD